MTPVPDLVAPVMTQIQAVKDALTPWAADHMYLNFAETRSPAAPLWTAYAYQRLRRIKAHVDPDDVIRSNHPIPPAR
jgi:sensor domain CHASE-containing protein